MGHNLLQNGRRLWWFQTPIDSLIFRAGSWPLIKVNKWHIGVPKGWYPWWEASDPVYQWIMPLWGQEAKFSYSDWRVNSHWRVSEARWPLNNQWPVAHWGISDLVSLGKSLRGTKTTNWHLSPALCLAPHVDEAGDVWFWASLQPGPWRIVYPGVREQRMSLWIQTIRDKFGMIIWFLLGVSGTLRVWFSQSG